MIHVWKLVFGKSQYKNKTFCILSFEMYSFKFQIEYNFLFFISGKPLTVNCKLFAKLEIKGNRIDWLLFNFYAKLTAILQHNFISSALDEPRPHPQVNFINLRRTSTTKKQNFRKVFPFPQTPYLCLLIPPVFNLAATCSRSKNCITQHAELWLEKFLPETPS